MNRKYQIFVSSTYVDLQEHRNLVIKAILEMGHIPVGMEMFSAADEEQWAVIKRNIEQTDYYVVIIANRYGSVTDTGISYTEKEYDYAIAQGIPSLGFVLDPTSPWPSNFTDTGPSDVSALNLFKEKIKKKHVSFWKNTDDLYGKCSIALSKSFTTHPREGWVRSSLVTDARVTEELTRLSAENAQLRNQISEARTAETEKQHDEELKTMTILRKNKRSMSVWLTGATTWKDLEPVSLYSLFLALAPELLIEKSVEDIARFTAQTIGGLTTAEHRWEFPVPSNIVKSWMADLFTLELVSPSNLQRPIADRAEYWTLSEKGKQVLRLTRRFALEKDSDSPAEAAKLPAPTNKGSRVT
jgi:Domain of unknown function (DUF4062)